MGHVRHGSATIKHVVRAAIQRSTARQCPRNATVARGDIAEARTEKRNLHLFVAIDRSSKFAVAPLVEKANRKTAWEFLEYLLEALPFKIHKILTPLGTLLTKCPAGQWTTASRSPSSLGPVTASPSARCASTCFVRPMGSNIA